MYNISHRVSLTIILFAFSHLIFSQELKQKEVKNADGFIEIYSFNKKTKQKEGKYIKIEKLTNDTIVKGFYNNGIRCGIWNYLWIIDSNNERIYLKYNFNENIFVEIPDYYRSIDSFYIRNEAEVILSKVDIPPIHLGYCNEIETLLQKNVIIPGELLMRRVSGVTIASFIIDKTGHLKNAKIEKSIDITNSREMNFSLLNAIEKLDDGNGISSKVNSIPVDSQFYILFYISHSVIDKEYIDKPYYIVVSSQLLYPQ
jgi:hypothetical protein